MAEVVVRTDVTEVMTETEVEADHKATTIH